MYLELVLFVDTDFNFNMSSSLGFFKQVVSLSRSHSDSPCPAGPVDQVSSVDLKVEDTNYGLHLEHLVCRLSTCNHTYNCVFRIGAIVLSCWS